MTMKKCTRQLQQFLKDKRSYLPWLGVGVIVLMILGVVISSIPPRSFILSTGAESGIYYRFAQQYQQQLAREGIDVQLRPGAGSIETLDRLAAGTVDVGFVQGGTVDDFRESNLQSLGSLYYEPIWIFHQKDLNLESLADLNGLSVNIGAEGSGITPV
ncbi:MAG: TAXI family TRAP transporter solute-binding subunit, partial [Aggregatilineales bacterium]